MCYKPLKTLLVGQLVVLDQDAYTLLLATWCVNKV